MAAGNDSQNPDLSSDSSARWTRIQDVLERALELTAEDRARFVEETCGGDEEERAEVARLLEAAEDSEFLLPPTDAARHSPPSEDVPEKGAMFGDYRLERELGQGGMGAVWLARREGDFDKQVAVKLVRTGLDSRAVLERFRRERQVLAELEHPNIARLIDGGSLPSGRPYLVMEFVEGARIDTYCDERRLGVAQRIELFLDVLDAVEYAHRKLVIHRDLKPHNVLVTDDGKPKLLDFGIAKVLAGAEREDTSPTLGGATPLTPRYASPEQIDGRAIATASDVYSLGVTLFELLTGQSPYGDTTSSVALVRAVCDSEPSRPSDVVAELEQADLRARFGRGTTPRALRQAFVDDLDWVLSTALRKEPDRRYASAERFADDLRRYLTGRPVAARPDSWSYRTRKFARRNPAAWVGSLLAILALIGATVVSVLAAGRAERSASNERQARRGVEEALTVLQDAILAPSIDLGQGLDTRVVDLLEQVEERLPSLEDPQVRIRLQLALGTTLGEHGEHPRAERLARAALATLESEVNDAPLRAVALEQLGIALYHQSLEREAIEFWEEGLRILRSLSPETLESRPQLKGLANNLLQAVASAWGDEGELARATEVYEEALTLAELELDTNPVLAINVRCNFADVLIQRGLYERALALVGGVQRDAEAVVGAEHTTTIFAGIIESWSEAHVGRLVTATERMRRTRTAALEIFGADHGYVWLTSWLLAELLLQDGRTEEARQLAWPLRDAAEPGTEEYLVASHLRGAILVALDRAEEAVPILESALRGTREALPNDDYLHATVRRRLGGAYAALGDSARARDELEAARSHFAAIDPAHPEAAALAGELREL